MTIELTAVRLTPAAPDRPLLIVGPSLGTGVEALWGQCADRLADHYQVVGWELPGHGRAPAATGPFTVAELTAAVVALVGRVNANRFRPGEAFEYAGDSVGGAVGLQLALEYPEQVLAVTLFCTGARIGDPAGWHKRAAQVRSQGTASMVDGSARRWFAPGFLDRDPAAGAALLDGLREVDDAGYAWTCEALAGYDLTDRLSEVRVPVTAVAGAHDVVCTPDVLATVAQGVPDGRLVVLDEVAHQAPVEAPQVVVDLIADRPRRADEARRAGFAVRRAVLGGAHVDRATAGTSDLTAPFQDFITRYAWGTVWTRPALSRRERSLMTLTALVAGGHLEELALHTRAAVRNGLSAEEIAECVLHSAIYCGVPAANSALRVVQTTLAEGEGPTDDAPTAPATS